MSLLASCNGVMDGLYDDEQDETPQSGIYVDASAYDRWYYINLHDLPAPDKNGSVVITDFVTIDTTEIAEYDADRTGKYLYEFPSFFDTGLDEFYLISAHPTRPQQDPAEWDIAIHRDNVRTNGGGVFMTDLMDISQVGAAEEYASLPYTPDTMDSTRVWIDNRYILSYRMGCQRIKTNKVLSSWLSFKPDIPPTYFMHGNVFILRMKDGTLAALRLKNHISTKGKKCCLTIEYKYPL